VSSNDDLTRSLEDVDLAAAMAAQASPRPKYNQGKAFKGQGRKKPARHGTHSGFVRERQVGMDACDACLAAHAAYARGELGSSETFEEREAKNARSSRRA